MSRSTENTTGSGTHLSRKMMNAIAPNLINGLSSPRSRKGPRNLLGFARYAATYPAQEDEENPKVEEAVMYLWAVG